MPVAGRNATQPSTVASADPDDNVWIAQRMVLDAGAQAATLRRRASVQAATVREAAEREAELIWQQASVRAAAIREAAERETAELRAAVVQLSAAPEPTTKSGTTREAEPGTRPAGRPQGRSRQAAALRVAAVATAALFLFAVTAGTVEIVLHGFAFFVFRSAGTGETPGTGLQEDQGPGQPDAPRPTPSHIKVTPSHVKVQLSPHGAVAVNDG